MELRREGEERVLRGAGLRCTERANDAIQQIFPFRYDFGDTFRKGLFPSEYVSERSVQNHRDVRTHVLELAGRVDAVHSRHGHVENNQVGS